MWWPLPFATQAENNTSSSTAISPFSHLKGAKVGLWCLSTTQTIPIGCPTKNGFLPKAKQDENIHIFLQLQWRQDMCAAWHWVWGGVASNAVQRWLKRGLIAGFCPWQRRLTMAGLSCGLNPRGTGSTSYLSDPSCEWCHRAAATVVNARRPEGQPWLVVVLRDSPSSGPSVLGNVFTVETRWRTRHTDHSYYICIAYSLISNNFPF